MTDFRHVLTDLCMASFTPGRGFDSRRLHHEGESPPSQLANDARAKEMGAVMKIVMPSLKGEADGAVVNRIVRELLA